MNISTEALYYCATIFLVSFIGSIVSEIYESSKDGIEKPINVRNVVGGGITGAMTLIGVKFVEDADFNKLLFFSFLFGLFGWRILGIIKNSALQIILSGTPKEALRQALREEEKRKEEEKKKKKEEEQDKTKNNITYSKTE